MPSTPARVTLRDVARRAGVSTAAASKALNGQGGVSAATREAVQAVAAELRFRPNRTARALVSRRSQSIGLLANELEGRFSLPVLAGIEDHGGEKELSVLLADGRGDPARERHHLAMLEDRQVDGIVLVGSRTNPRPSVSAEVSVPVVYAYTPSEDEADASFVPDDEAGGRSVAEHLLRRGRRRVAYIGGDPGWAASGLRERGVRSVLEGAGLALEGTARHGAWTQSWGREAAVRLLEESRPDAICCGSDVVATGVIDVLRDRGVTVPDDVAVAGFDDWDLFVGETRPPLTSVDMRLEALGGSAVAALLDLLAGVPRAGIELLPCDLVVRGSTG